jgi:hypothetical protein
MSRCVENRLYKLYFRQNRTHPESADLTYKEGVAGSNPASPTTKLPANNVICARKKRAGIHSPALLLQPRCNPSESGSRYGSQRRLHCVRRGVLHVG